MKTFTTYYDPNKDNLEVSYYRYSRGHTTTWDLSLEEAKNLKEQIIAAIEQIQYYNKTKEALEDFHNSEKENVRGNLSLLHMKLVRINPWDEQDNPDEHKEYEEWVNMNIDDYKNGDHPVLDLKSSGGILQSINLETGPL